MAQEGWEVSYPKESIESPADLFVFSVIFSWDLPNLFRQVGWVKGQGEIRIGGPACTYNAALIEHQTGIVPHVGPDWRFEEQPGEYKLVRTTRGCPGGVAGPCYACPVPRMDGNHLRILSCSFPTTPNCGIVDDNIAAAPWAHHLAVTAQLKRYKAIEMSSGWEPWAWRPWMWDLWRDLPMNAWRTAFDGLYEESHVADLIRFWRAQGVPQKKIWVYVLAGGVETFDEALYRATKVLEWGGEPRIQPYKPNSWLRPRSVPYLQPEKGWTHERVVNLPRYFYGYHWRRMGFEEFLERKANPGRNI